ncbi:MAG: Asp-tRNA(Asn)/Glu-tRNA(Gln) amidotransferase subunit GatC [Alphaproteobacteria bacterium]|nr:Asp-tRNA(Asn)/Glu-tRNA(Gln) amidotransferase subunit GatC [Alphaproteobacteria bacterium]MCB1551112.1 Asp-tRNA(Asn)/Glu-tRNA(Gln) amidotransferase subunit GatC [Alphaproteobacteria bacterium]MCB9985017.1 Asp-tRNA(Asn)/Glu-tRNA(Gln) amidotransferase subunit GatC [Micavibrio sp.]HRK97407.1 Asp-tRNA(Asn)/Glu-tRNA(Gln) amidotransferase subunit GatC [Alphaproteobacteria bacterium]
MSIDKSTVSKIANLARIKVTEEDLEYYAPQLQNILSWAEQLQEVDTTGVEPLANVSEINLTLREDKITDGQKRDEILKNAPETVEGFYVVTKIVE